MGSLLTGVANILPVISLAVYALYRSRRETAASASASAAAGDFKFGRISVFLFFLSFVLAFCAIPSHLLGLTSLASTLVILVSAVLFSVVFAATGGNGGDGGPLSWKKNEFTRVLLHLLALLLFSFSSVLFYVYAYYAIEYSISKNNNCRYQYFSCDPLLLLLGETILSEKTQYLDERVCALSDHQMLLMNCLNYIARAEENEDVILFSGSSAGSTGSSTTTVGSSTESFRGGQGGGAAAEGEGEGEEGVGGRRRVGGRRDDDLGVLLLFFSSALSRAFFAASRFLRNTYAFANVKAHDYVLFVSSYSKLSRKVVANVDELLRKRALKYNKKYYHPVGLTHHSM